MKLHSMMPGILALALSAGAAQAETEVANPNIAEVMPGDTVKVERLPEHIYLRNQNDPDDLIWQRIPAYRTQLYSAPPVHESVALRFEEGAMRGKHMYFQVARTSERFYVRMFWKDATEDRQTSVDQFSDAVAVQYALKGKDTSYMMGTNADKPVNIWYWRADGSAVENLAAGGFGSTTALEQQSVSGDGYYVTTRVPQDNQWQVVMSRPLKPAGKHEIDLRSGVVPVSFAVWQGADNERDGNKRITHTWIMLDNGAAK